MIYDIMSYHHHISLQHKLAMTFLLFNNTHSLESNSERVSIEGFSF